MTDMMDQETAKGDDGMIDPDRIDWDSLVAMVDTRIRLFGRCWIDCRRTMPADDYRTAHHELFLPIVHLLLHFVECVRHDQLESPRKIH
jgi:hypothetical protein